MRDEKRVTRCGSRRGWSVGCGTWSSCSSSDRMFFRRSRRARVDGGRSRQGGILRTPTGALHGALHPEGGAVVSAACAATPEIARDGNSHGGVLLESRHLTATDPAALPRMYPSRRPVLLHPTTPMELAPRSLLDGLYRRRRRDARTTSKAVRVGEAPPASTAPPPWRQLARGVLVSAARRPRGRALVATRRQCASPRARRRAEEVAICSPARRRVRASPHGRCATHVRLLGVVHPIAGCARASTASRARRARGLLVGPTSPLTRPRASIRPLGLAPAARATLESALERPDARRAQPRRFPEQDPCLRLNSSGPSTAPSSVSPSGVPARIAALATAPTSSRLPVGCSSTASRSGSLISPAQAASYEGVEFARVVGEASIPSE